MVNGLNEKEAKILDYLKSLSKDGNKRIEFYINDAVSLTQIRMEELEEALIALEEKGFLKIVKVPASNNFLNFIRKKLLMLDAAFLTDQVSREDYTKKYEETISCISDLEVRHIYSPLPPADLSDLVVGLSNTLEYVEKLRREKENIKKETYEKLVTDYNEELREVINSTLRYVDSVAFAIELNKRVIDDEEKELEMIEVDEKIKNIDKSERKKAKMEKIAKAKSAIGVISKKIAGNEDTNTKEKISILEKDLKKLKEEYEVIQARVMIEGNETLKKSANELHDTILSKEKSLDELKETLKKEMLKRDIKRLLEDISQKADSLFRDKLLTEDIMKGINEIKTKIEKICQEYNIYLEQTK